MKKLTLVLLSLFLTSFSYKSDENINRSKETSTTTISNYQRSVVICTGNSSKRYHKGNNCTGLRNCKGNRVTVSIDEATKKGRTPCKVCYK